MKRNHKQKEKYNKPLSVKIGTALKVWKSNKEDVCNTNMMDTPNTKQD